VALIIRKLTEAMIRAMRPDEELAAILREDIRPLWFAQVVRLLVFTGQRRGEVVALGHYPEWIAADGWATIPGTRYKSGRAQRVYLAPPALEVLKDFPAGALGELGPPQGCAGRGERRHRLALLQIPAVLHALEAHMGGTVGWEEGGEEEAVH
jgi:integrase